MGINSRRVIRQLLAFCIYWGLISNLFANSSEVDEFTKWNSDQQKEFIDYVAQDQKEWAAYRGIIEQQWAKFIGSTKKDWVEYSSDKDTRSIIDFKKGEITLETVVPVDLDNKGKSDSTLPDIVKERIKQRLKELLANKSLFGSSPIQGQVISIGGVAVTNKNIDGFSKNELEKKIKITSKPFTAKDGKKRIKARVSIKMVPDHLKVRANKFKETVETYASKYDVDKSLVYAVIHTESYFNPKARSHVPAYGLMQLVPNSGGRDAYRYVKGRDLTPSPTYLYSPQNNILLGVAYLDLLSKREFKKIQNKTTKHYLIIAAYNTGAGNVSRAFTGKKSIRKAIKYINKMTPEEVYDTLVAKLPYDETKHYIQKVVKRRALYENL